MNKNKFINSFHYIKNTIALKKLSKFGYLVFFSLLLILLENSCSVNKRLVSKVGSGWSKNSINTTKFRKNAITTFKDYQFLAYYDKEGFVTLGKRKITDKQWETYQTQYMGNVEDAHNSISIAIDGDGYLHVSWDQHNTKLRYAKSIAPNGLQLSDELSMTGLQESDVTYPEFYNLPNGDLLFFYRSGKSGRGNMVINSYNPDQKKWVQLHDNLIDGQEERSAYWQACTDLNGYIHLSWVWRETWDVETNHDLCYAISRDGGLSWEKSSGEKYVLPINAKTAECAWKIPQKSSLINQTTITTDQMGMPYICTYWSNEDVPQYQIVYQNNKKWNKINTNFLKNYFYLGGGGTKRVPISRPDILVDKHKNQNFLYILFRAEEFGNKISLAYKNILNDGDWKIKPLSKYGVGQWEPNYDFSLWNKSKILNIFSQKVTQIDGEGLAKTQASTVNVLQINSLPH